LERWLHLLPKDGTLLIGLQGVQRVPYVHRKATVGIMHISGEPPGPQAGDLFVRHGHPIGLLILLPTSYPVISPGNPHKYARSSYTCVQPSSSTLSVHPQRDKHRHDSEHAQIITHAQTCMHGPPPAVLARVTSAGQRMTIPAW
jgi:hypothetical protein